jgi:hypothetical protein
MPDLGITSAVPILDWEIPLYKRDFNGGVALSSFSFLLMLNILVEQRT